MIRSRPVLRRIELNCQSPQALGEFYAELFDAVVAAPDRRDAVAAKQSTGVEIAVERVELRIGEEAIALTRFAGETSPYPTGIDGGNLAFQHFAVPVSDMTAAYDRLRSLTGWTAISTGGPQRLPERSGGVSAFKFRDPEGHPLEFIAFPADSGPDRWRSSHGRLFLGVDHSALSVADAEASEEFYARLGFVRGSKSLNFGPEQARLDGILDAEVDVRGLWSRATHMHIELLRYLSPSPRASLTEDTDIAATRLVIDGVARPSRLLRDPDGHRVFLSAQGQGD